MTVKSGTGSSGGLTKLDWLVEATAFAGLAVGIAVIAWGAPALPDMVPTHIGAGGVIDSHGSKWGQLAAFAIVMGLNYILLSCVAWYLGRSAKRAGNENARTTYRIGRTITRWAKMAFAWLLAILVAWYVMAMPDNPKSALGSEIVLVLILMPLLAYSFIAIIVPPMSESRFNGMSKMLRK